MDDSDNEIDLSFLNEIEDQVTKDPDLYGRPGNRYNPELHMLCMVDRCTSMAEVIAELADLLSSLSSLYSSGWEVTGEVEDGVISTYWTVENESPPIEHSNFVDGRDLDGNEIDFDDEQ